MVELHKRFNDTDGNKVIRLNSANDRKKVPLAPIKLCISNQQKKKIIKSLFGNNEKEYEDCIAELQGISEWKNALAQVEKTLARRNIELHAPAAVVFTDILYARYFPEKEPINSTE
ncbi:MAG: hypothetical protein ACOY90_00070 [Candidatus Zhuqueibacterota bacterium]